MSFAELGRTIIKNNTNALWKKPFLRKFKNSNVYETDSKTLIKPFHKKANPEQIKKQKELNDEKNRLNNLKKITAIFISLIIIVGLYLLIEDIFFSGK